MGLYALFDDAGLVSEWLMDVRKKVVDEGVYITRLQPTKQVRHLCFRDSERKGVFTQMMRRQCFDAKAETDWTDFLMLSIGRHVKFDTRTSKF